MEAGHFASTTTIMERTSSFKNHIMLEGIFSHIMPTVNCPSEKPDAARDKTFRTSDCEEKCFRSKFYAVISSPSPWPVQNYLSFVKLKKFCFA